MNASVDLPEAVLTELPSEVAVIDDEANIVYTNGTWQRFAEENGLAGDPAGIGQNYLDVCDASPESGSATDAADGIRSLLAGEREAFSMEYPCHSPDERRYFSMDAKRFRHDGEASVLIVHADVTDRRVAEERVRAQNERLESVASVLSHDLRNPLNVASGYTDLLAEAEDATSRDEAVSRIRSALDRMSAIVDDALSLARKTAAEDTERVDLRTAAEGAWANVQTEAASLDVVDTFEFEADASLLDNLFENLFRNSVEHGSTDSRTGSGDAVEHGSTGSQASPDDDDSAERAGADVSVRAGTLDGDAGFYVEDDGPGLPPERRDEAFDAGFTTGDGDENTGLGLSIVESIVDAHGRQVRATDGRDGGARFEVRT